MAGKSQQIMAKCMRLMIYSPKMEPGKRLDWGRAPEAPEPNAERCEPRPVGYTDGHTTRVESWMQYVSSRVDTAGQLELPRVRVP